MGMTLDEAKQVLRHIVQVADTSDCGIKEIDGTDEEAIDMAIKALEQEPVLDKIIAEIEQLTITKGGDDYVRKMAELFSLKMKVLQIIDKYKAESEDKE